MSVVFQISGVDPQDGVCTVLGTDDVTDGEGSNVVGVLEVLRIERLELQLVKDLPALGPFAEDGRRWAVVAPVTYSSLLYSLVPRMMPF